ncbi:MAG: energy-coupling factor transporter transmembrane protein EcfT [Coriobacteriia bacterium]|nr:energy-coupling factor transporter transmembrane protein EcfT [Coriobacteriia bacterium]
MLYFVLVIVFSMVFFHPVCLGISFLCAFSYAFVLRGAKALRFSLMFLLPMLVLAVLINPLFSHQGITVLAYLPGGNPITLESVLYGLAAGIMLVTVISWFSCYNEVMTSDKFVYLFGRVIPSLSLVFSMALRFVPRFTEHIKEVSHAQRCIGRDVTQGGLVQRAKQGIKILSSTITWALENSIETADSMKSRGYGLASLPKRTAFSMYRFGRRDKRALVFIGLCALYVVVGALLGGLTFRYFPLIFMEWTPYAMSLFVVYLALCLLPHLVRRREGSAWEKSQWKQEQQREQTQQREQEQA